MAAPDVVQVISHYQRDIEKICSRPERAVKYEDRLLHCVNKLNKLPVSVNHLQETGVGKTINSLRKINGQKGINEAAKSLVAKWKAMVVKEDEEEERRIQAEATREDAKRIKMIQKVQRSEYSPTSSNNDIEADYKPSTSKSKSNSYSPQSLSQNTDSDTSYSPSKKTHKPNGYSPGSPKANGIEVYCYSPSKKVEGKTEKHKKEDKRDKHKASSKNEADKHDLGDVKVRKESSSKSSHKESKDSHSSRSSKHKESSSSKNKNSSTTKSKDKHSSSKSGEKSESSSSKSKTTGKNSDKVSSFTEKTNPVIDDDINSVSGASFADALCVKVPKKSSSNSSKKKSSHSDSSKSFSSNESSSKIVAKRHNDFSPLKHPDELLDEKAGPSYLAPLDLDIVSTLSVPTPNYRPLAPVNIVEKRQRAQAEEDALAKIMSNKNSRTKVYSGVKGGFTYVPSLYELCCRVLQQHIDALEYTGGIPYSLLKPVLDTASPSQLYQFEHYNPYIIEDTDHLWQFHVNREFRGEERQEMESWRDMYLRCLDEREMKYKMVTANIHESLKKSVPVRTTKLAYVDVAKPPRNILKKQMKNGTGKPDFARLIGKNNPDAVPVRPPPKSAAPTREAAAPSFKVKPKVAPLMMKTLKSIKQTRFKR